MAKVRYKAPTSNMSRMVINPSEESRPSLGMTEVKGEIYYLSPETVIPFKNQARKEINEVALNELASSIQSQGIIQPLQVIPSLEYEGKFEVVSGERRLLAAKKLGLNIVPCMILAQDVDPDEVALIENIQRENLNAIELSDAIAYLVQRKGHGSQTEIADRIGLSKQKISQHLAISRLPGDIKAALMKRKDLKMGFLRKLAYLDSEAKLREMVFGGEPIRRQFRSILRLSFDGESFRYDHLKIDALTDSEKNMLEKELRGFVEKLKN